MIRTLAEAARHRMVLRITCRRCSRSSDLWAGDVVQFVAPHRYLSQIRFRCQGCGSRDVACVPCEIERPEQRRAIVWYPQRLR